MDPIYKFTREDLLKIVAKFCSDNLEEFDQEKTALSLHFNDEQELEVYLVELSNLN